jgi:adenosylmethionine-8-amino-7-oxononanoate aminotransferase
MIADEVMCGSGRCGTWRALEHDGVEPDIMSVAKGLAGGYIPLSAAIYHERLREPMYRTHGGLMTGHTFTGHTAACAAGVAVQRIVKRDNLLNKVREDGAYFLSLLQNAIGKRDYVGDIRGRGFFIGIELVQDRTKKEPFPADLQVYARLRDRAFENGLICYPVGGNVNGHRGDIIILSPPYIASRGELEEIVDKLQRSLSDVMVGITMPKA